MSFLSPIILRNPYYIGDTVLIEPIARLLEDKFQIDIYIQSAYSELLLNHPTVKYLPLESSIEEVQYIDLKEPIRSMQTIDNKQIYMPGKLKRLYEWCGLICNPIQPKLYLSDEELSKVNLLRKTLPFPRIGLCIQSRHKFKNYPYTKSLAKFITKYFGNVYLFDKDDNNGKINKYSGIPVINKSFRELMIYLKAMDVVIGPDTGPIHIAGALDVPILVLGYKVVSDLYDIYPNCKLISGVTDNRLGIHTIPVKKVLRNIASIINEYKPVSPEKKVINIKSQKDDIALFRLDGLGGSITLTDQATKIYEMTGIKPVLIVRNYKDIFEGHPHIKEIVEVGYVKWVECLEEMKERFDTIADIRFAPGKWHQQDKQWFEQDFSKLQDIFDKFPLNYREFEIYGLHQIQLTDKILGLPYETIDSKVYNFEDIKHFDLPDDYIVFSNGVDIQHQGMLQTKLWYYWDELIKLLDLPVIQIGSKYDPVIRGVYKDLRSKTKLGELTSIIKQARMIVCTEGGIMHLAYAVDSPNVLVLRGPTRGKLFEYPGHKFVDSYLCDNCWSTTGDWYMNCPKKIGAVCMKTITPERVEYNIRRLLSENMA